MLPYLDSLLTECKELVSTAQVLALSPLSYYAALTLVDNIAYAITPKRYHLACQVPLNLVVLCSTYLCMLLGMYLRTRSIATYHGLPTGETGVAV